MSFVKIAVILLQNYENNHKRHRFSPLFASNSPSMSKVLHHIVVYGNDSRSQNGEHLLKVLAALLKIDARVSLETSFAQFLATLDMPDEVSLSRFGVFEGVVPEADLAISIGGDGTFLSAAAHIGALEIPILGVNTGHLGFLADVMPDEVEDALAVVTEGRAYYGERCVLQVECLGHDDFPLYPFALNDVALLKHDNASLIKVTATVDGELLTDYIADGLIVSTPTGSTGYSLAVGGPVIVPQSRTFCLSAVAPHSLTMRPMILRDDVTIDLSVSSRTGNFMLSIDGRSVSLSDDYTLRLHRAPYDVKVVKVKPQQFFSTLREKLMWGVDHRNLK